MTRAEPELIKMEENRVQPFDLQSRVSNMTPLHFGTIRSSRRLVDLSPHSTYFQIPLKDVKMRFKKRLPDY